MSTLNAVRRSACEQIITDICGLNWATLGEADVVDVARAYYFFSIQFRENLRLARALYPDDANLLDLEGGECDTDNLSPYPGVAAAGEKLDHDEFMRRLLLLTPRALPMPAHVSAIGERYLAEIRAIDAVPRAMSIASYENTGLERVFTAILQAPHYETPLLTAFRFFLTEHIRFDSDPQAGHGALSRHLTSDDSIIPLWAAFQQLLVDIIPALSQPAAEPAIEARLQMEISADSIRACIIRQLREIAARQQKTLAPLHDELPLMASGVDSLCIAILVAGLDDELGLDPFSTGEDMPFPVTLGEFIGLYQRIGA